MRNSQVTYVTYILAIGGILVGFTSSIFGLVSFLKKMGLNILSYYDNLIYSNNAYHIKLKKKRNVNNGVNWFLPWTMHRNINMTFNKSTVLQRIGIYFSNILILFSCINQYLLSFNFYV